MEDRYRRGRRTEGERHPLRRLSSIGSGTSGWRSTLESGGSSFGTFVIGSLIAFGAFALFIFIASR